MNIKEKLLVIDLGKAYGGMEKLVENIVDGFIDEFEITLAINSNGEFAKKSSVVNRCKVIRFNNNIKTFVKTIYKIRNYVKKEKIKTIHCNGTPANIIGIILKNTMRIKFISTIHSDNAYEFSGKKKDIYLFVEKLTSKYADYIVTVSKDLEKKLKVRHTKYEDRIVTIYNGIELCNGQSKITNLINKEKKFLFVGRLTEIKNIPYLLESLSKLKKSGKNFLCDIIGEGELESELKKMISDLELDNHVNLLGYKDNVENYMNNSDALIMTSKMEGIPLVILEAFASKLPVISSDVGGIKEMLVNNKNGILYNLNNKHALSEILSSIIDEKYDLNVIREEAYKEYKTKWTREVMLNNYRKLYLEK